MRGGAEVLHDALRHPQHVRCRTAPGTAPPRRSAGRPGRASARRRARRPRPPRRPRRARRLARARAGPMRSTVKSEVPPPKSPISASSSPLRRPRRTRAPRRRARGGSGPPRTRRAAAALRRRASAKASSSPSKWTGRPSSARRTSAPKYASARSRIWRSSAPTSSSAETRRPRMIVPRKEREPRWCLMERSRRPSAPCSTNWRSASPPDETPPASGKQRMLRRIVGSDASGIERHRLEHPVAVRRREERVAGAEVDRVEGRELGHAAFHAVRTVRAARSDRRALGGSARAGGHLA